jgi:hypothetical protein
MCSDRPGHQNTYPPPFSFAALTFACGFPAGGMVFCVMKLLWDDGQWGHFKYLGIAPGAINSLSFSNAV